jgi:protein TIF31
LTIDQEFTDSSGNKHIISGGVEVKGILGSDKRHYLLDSMRLSPRDLNYGEQSVI